MSITMWRRLAWASAVLVVGLAAHSRADEVLVDSSELAAMRARMDSYEAELAKLVTVDSLIGAGQPLNPAKLHEHETAGVVPEMPRVRPD